MRTVVVGIDAQKRGIAVSLVDASTGAFVESHWIELEKEPLEVRVKEAYDGCYHLLSGISKEYDILIISVEQPTARTGTSSYMLWLIAGAVVAGAVDFAEVVDTMVPLSWKKHSGLNVWGKDNDRAKRGIIEKTAIADGLIALDPTIPANLTPVDKYDSIAIARAACLRNLERINA